MTGDRRKMDQKIKTDQQVTMYPLFLKLNNKKCLVIGGGKVAERKVLTLLSCRALVTVISPDITKILTEKNKAGDFKYLKRTYSPGDCEGFFMVISCTNDHEVNKSVYREASQNQVLINAADDPDHCNFYVPSTLSRGPLSVAVSTGGAFPYFARQFRLFLEGIIPDIGTEINTLSGLRVKMKNIESDKKKQWFQKEIEPRVKELLEKIKTYAESNWNKP
jgi:precorrin-2 dehydrogenase/sirohydrochlorin ferrochelatase